MMMTKSRLAVHICSILLICLCNDPLFSQMQTITDADVHSEGTFYKKNGILYTNAIVVKFNDRVIDLPGGIRYAAKTDIRVSFPAVAEFINSFEQKYGAVSLVKQILNAEWGDVTRPHKITGQLVQIKDLSQLFTIRFTDPVPLDSTLNAFGKLPEVEYAHQPISIVYYGEPDDPQFQDQWNLDVINAVSAWDITRGSNTIKIGIVDQGTDQDHEDLQGKIDGGDGVDGTSDYKHGTWVAGVAAAETDNTKGVASLGWNLRLFTYGNGRIRLGNESFTAENISEAADNVDVINMSFGTLRRPTLEDIPSGCSNPPSQAFLDKMVIPEDYQSIEDAVGNAVAQGVICVSAAGNSTKNATFVSPECDPMTVPFADYPSQYSGVIGVSGTELVNQIEEFKDGWNYGSFVDVAGPAVDIPTTNFGGGYTSPNGTSFSSPLVAALAGLIKSINSGLTVQQVTDIITSSAEKIDPSNCDGSPVYDANGWNPCLGYGRINAYEALKYTLENYGGTLVNDLVIDAGETYNFQEGVTLKFKPNAGLIVDGTLNVNGTSSNKVTFKRTGSTSDWEGIEFRTGSAGTVTHAIVDYAYNSTGISISNVSPTIEYSTIKNNLLGLNLYYSSSIIQNCILTDNEDAVVDRYSAAQYLGNTIYENYVALGDGLGMLFIDSDPVLFDNLIYDNEGAGVYGKTASYVQLGSSSETGNNVIANNSHGILSNGSNTYVYLGQYSSWGGDNSVYDNTPWDAAASSYSYIVAEMTWWGSASGGDITYDGTRAVYDDYKLSSDPNDPAPLIASIPYSPSPIASLSKTGNMQQSATAALDDGSKDEIFDLIQRRNLYRKGESEGFISHLELTINGKKDTETVNFAKSMLALEYLLDGQLQKALVLAEANLAAFADTDKEPMNLLTLFDISLYGLRNKTAAAAILSQYVSKYPNDIITKRLQIELDKATNKAIGKSLGTPEIVANIESLQKFELLPNYPNPFNPSTTILFELPQEELVVLRIYNLRGQLVTELINELKEAGRHSVLWNSEDAIGRFVASGVYILTLELGRHKLTRKLMLVK